MHFVRFTSTVARPVTRGQVQGVEAPSTKFFAPLEKCVGDNLKILDIVQKIWAPLGKLFAPLGVPSWLRACHLTVAKSRTARLRFK